VTFVFNLSLSAGVFPVIWKQSFVVPIFKSGDKRDVFCYHGISIIPKLFEKILCHRITPVVCPVISITHNMVLWRAARMSVIWSNLRMASLAKSRTDGRLMKCTPTFVRLSAECFVNFIWWSAFVLDGVLLDRSNTTCQIGGLLVRIDSMSFRNSASHLGPIFFILDINGNFGY
jgi:hypothetical protein